MHRQQHTYRMSGYNHDPGDKHVVHWFRKGLRLHDNPSLKEGLKGCCTYRCIFILDPWFAGSSNVDINKWRCEIFSPYKFISPFKSKMFLPNRFLLESLEDLDQNLRKLNSRLFVIRGQPAGVLPKLFKVKFPSHTRKKRWKRTVVYNRIRSGGFQSIVHCARRVVPREDYVFLRAERTKDHVGVPDVPSYCRPL